MAYCDNGTINRNRRAQFRNTLFPFKSVNTIKLDNTMEEGSSQSTSPNNPYGSPIRTGRTVREVSKEIDDLRKENFKLKLHIYFMEEKIADITGPENLKKVKRDIQSHVEVMDVQKEMQNLKQDLELKSTMLTDSQEMVRNKENDLREANMAIWELQLQINNLSQEIQKKEENFYSPIGSENDNAPKEAFKFSKSDIDLPLMKLPSDVSVGTVAEDHDLKKLVEQLQTTIAENEKELEEVKEKVEELSEENKKLEEKNTMKKKTIAALAHKLNKLYVVRDEDLLQDISDGLDAAEGDDIPGVVSAVNNIKRHFAQILSKPVDEVFGNNSEKSSIQDTVVAAHTSSDKTFSKRDCKSTQVSDDPLSMKKSDLSEASLVPKLTEETRLQQITHQRNVFAHQTLILQRHLEKLAIFLERLVQDHSFQSNTDTSSRIFHEATSYLNSTLVLSKGLSQTFSDLEFVENCPSEESVLPKMRSQSSVGSRVPAHPSKDEGPDDEGRAVQSETCYENMNKINQRRRWSIPVLPKQQSKPYAPDINHFKVLGISDTDEYLEISQSEQTDKFSISQPIAHQFEIGDSVLKSKPRQCWNLSDKMESLNGVKIVEQDTIKPFYGRTQDETYKQLTSDSDIWSEPDRNVSVQRIGLENQTLLPSPSTKRKSRDRTTKETSSATKSQCENRRRRRRSGSFKSCASTFQLEERLSVVENQQDAFNSLQNVLTNISSQLSQITEASNVDKTGNVELSSEIGTIKEILNQVANELTALKGSQQRSNVEVENRLSTVENQQPSLNTLQQLVENVNSHLSQITKAASSDNIGKIDISSELNTVKGDLKQFINEIRTMQESVKDTIVKQDAIVIEKLKEITDRVLKYVKSDDDDEQVSPRQTKRIAEEALTELDNYKQQLLSVASSLFSKESLESMAFNKNNEIIANLQLSVDNERAQNAKLLKDIDKLSGDNESLQKQLSEVEKKLALEQKKCSALLFDEQNTSKESKEKQNFKELVLELSQDSSKKDEKVKSVETMCKELTSSLKEVKSKLKDMEARCRQYEKDFRTVQHEKEKVNGELKGLKMQIQEYENDIVATNIKKEAAEKKAKSHEEHIQRYEDCFKQQQRSFNELKDAASEKQNLIEHLRDKCLQYENDILALKQENNTFMDRNKVLNEEIKTQTNKITEMTKKRIEHENEKDKLLLTIDILRKDLSILEENIGENIKNHGVSIKEKPSEQASDANQELHSQIMRLKEDVLEKDTFIQCLNEEIDNLQENNQTLSDQLSKLEDSYHLPVQERETLKIPMSSALRESHVKENDSTSPEIPEMNDTKIKMDLEIKGLKKQLGLKDSIIQEQKSAIEKLQTILQQSGAANFSDILKKSPNSFQKEKEKMSAHVKKLEKQIEEFQIQLANFREDLERKDSIIQEQRTLIKTHLGEKEDLLKKLSADNIECDLQDEELPKESKNYCSRCKELLKDISVSNETNASAEASIQDLQEEISKLNENALSITKDAKDKDSVIQKLRNKFAYLQNEFCGISNSDDSTQSNKRDTNNLMNELNNFFTAFTNLKYETVDKDFAIQDQASQITDLVSEVEELRKEIQDKDFKIQEYEGKLADPEKESKNINDLNKSRSAFQTDIADFETQVNNLKRDLSYKDMIIKKQMNAIHELKGKLTPLDLTSMPHVASLQELENNFNKIQEPENVIQKLQDNQSEKVSPSIFKTVPFEKTDVKLEHKKKIGRSDPGCRMIEDPAALLKEKPFTVPKEINSALLKTEDKYLREQTEDLLNELRTKTVLIEKYKAAIAALQNDLKSKNTPIKELREQEGLERQDEVFIPTGLNEQIGNLREKSASTQSSLSSDFRNKELKVMIEQLQRELKVKDIKIDEHKDTIDGLQNDLQKSNALEDNLGMQIKTLNSRYTVLMHELQNKQSDLGKQATENENLKRKIETLGTENNVFNALNKLIGKLSECQRKVDILQASSSEKIKMKIKDLNSQIKDLNIEIKDLKLAIIDKDLVIEKQKNDTIELKRKLQDLKTTDTRSKTEDFIDKDLEAIPITLGLQNKIDELSTKLVLVNNELQNKITVIDDNLHEIAQLKAQLDIYGTKFSVYENLDKLLEQIPELQQTISMSRAFDLEHLKSENKNMNFEINRLKNELSSKNSSIQEYINTITDLKNNTISPDVHEKLLERIVSLERSIETTDQDKIIDNLKKKNEFLMKRVADLEKINLHLKARLELIPELETKRVPSFQELPEYHDDAVKVLLGQNQLLKEKVDALQNDINHQIEQVIAEKEDKNNLLKQLHNLQQMASTDESPQKLKYKMNQKHGEKAPNQPSEITADEQITQLQGKIQELKNELSIACMKQQQMKNSNDSLKKELMVNTKILHSQDQQLLQQQSLLQLLQSTNDEKEKECIENAKNVIILTEEKNSLIRAISTAKNEVECLNNALSSEKEKNEDLLKELFNLRQKFGDGNQKLKILEEQKSLLDEENKKLQKEFKNLQEEMNLKQEECLKLENEVIAIKSCLANMEATTPYIFDSFPLDASIHIPVDECEEIDASSIPPIEEPPFEEFDDENKLLDSKQSEIAQLHDESRQKIQDSEQDIFKEKQSFSESDDCNKDMEPKCEIPNESIIKSPDLDRRNTLLDAKQKKIMKLQDDLRQKDQEIQDLRKEISERMSSFIELQCRCKELESKCEMRNKSMVKLQVDYDVKFQLLESEEQKHIHLHTELDVANAEIQDLKKEIVTRKQSMSEAVKQAESSDADHETLIQAIAKLEEELDIRTKDLVLEKQKNVDLDKELNAKNEEIQTLEKEVEDKNSELFGHTKSVEARNETLIEAITKLQKEIDSKAELLEYGKLQIMQLMKELDAKNNENQALKNQIAAWEQHLLESFSCADNVDAKLETLRAIIRKLRGGLDMKITQLNIEKEENINLRQKLEIEDKELLDLKEEIATRKQSFLETLDRAKTINATSGTLIETIAKLQEELDIKTKLLEAEKLENVHLYEKLDAESKEIEDLRKQIEGRKRSYLEALEHSKSIDAKHETLLITIAKLQEELDIQANDLESEKLKNMHLYDDLYKKDADICDLMKEIEERKLSNAKSYSNAKDLEGKCEILNKTILQLQENLNSKTWLLDSEQKEINHLFEELSKEYQIIQDQENEIQANKLDLDELSETDELMVEKCKKLNQIIVQIQESLNDQIKALETEKQENSYLNETLQKKDNEIQNLKKEISSTKLNMLKCDDHAKNLDSKHNILLEIIAKLQEELDDKSKLVELEKQENLKLQREFAKKIQSLKTYITQKELNRFEDTQPRYHNQIEERLKVPNDDNVTKLDENLAPITKSSKEVGNLSGKFLEMDRQLPTKQLESYKLKLKIVQLQDELEKANEELRKVNEITLLILGPQGSVNTVDKKYEVLHSFILESQAKLDQKTRLLTSEKEKNTKLHGELNLRNKIIRKLKESTKSGSELSIDKMDALGEDIKKLQMEVNAQSILLDSEKQKNMKLQNDLDQADQEIQNLNKQIMDERLNTVMSRISMAKSDISKKFSTTSELEHKMSEKQDMNTMLPELQNELKQMQEENDDLKTYVADLEAKVKNSLKVLMEEKDKLKDNMKALSKKNRKLESIILDKDAEFDAQKVALTNEFQNACELNGEVQKRDERINDLELYIFTLQRKLAQFEQQPDTTLRIPPDTLNKQETRSSTPRQLLISQRSPAERQKLEQLLAKLSALLNTSPEALTEYIDHFAEYDSLKTGAIDLTETSNIINELENKNAILEDQLNQSKQKISELRGNIQAILANIETFHGKDSPVYCKAKQINKSFTVTKQETQKINEFKGLMNTKWNLHHSILKLEKELCKNSASYEKQLKFIEKINNMHSFIQSSSIFNRSDVTPNFILIGNYTSEIMQDYCSNLGLDIKCLHNIKILFKYLIIPLIKNVRNSDQNFADMTNLYMQNVSKKLDVDNFENIGYVKDKSLPEDEFPAPISPGFPKRDASSIPENAYGEIASLQNENENLRNELRKAQTLFRKGPLGKDHEEPSASMSRKSASDQHGPIVEEPSTSSAKAPRPEQQAVYRKPNITNRSTDSIYEDQGQKRKIKATKRFSEGFDNSVKRSPELQDDEYLLAQRPDYSSPDQGIYSDLNQEPRRISHQELKASYYAAYREPVISNESAGSTSEDHGQRRKLKASKTLSQESHHSVKINPELQDEEYLQVQRSNYSLSDRGSNSVLNQELEKIQYQVFETSFHEFETELAAPYAILQLEDFELLKKEVEEIKIEFKSIDFRTKNGLTLLGKDRTPTKSFERNTFKAILDCCTNVEVCIERAQELFGKVTISSYPVFHPEQYYMLLQNYKQLEIAFRQLQAEKEEQSIKFEDTLQRLKRIEHKKEQSDQIFLRQLVKTKKVLREVKNNLSNQEIHQDQTTPNRKIPTKL